MIELELADPAWTAALPDAEAIAAQAAQAALDTADQVGDVVVLLASDAALAELNQRFRGKAGPTNVLSFPAPPSARPHLGDVAVAHGACAREAAAQGKPLSHHLMHLVAHGVLHLVGYDHQSEGEAEIMEALERRLLQAMGAPDPYQASSPGGPDAL